MLDPQTLRVGDIVVFGGKVEKQVKKLYLSETHRYSYIGWYDEGPIMGFDNNLWEIAEFKQK